MLARTFIIGAAAVLTLSLAGLAAMSWLGQAPAMDAMPAVSFVGHDRKIAESKFVLIKDEAAWKAL